MQKANFISIGAIVGIYFGVKNQKGFWMTMGYALALGITGGLIGEAYENLKK
jgi:hypothetical protein